MMNIKILEKITDWSKYLKKMHQNYKTYLIVLFVHMKM